MLHHISARRLRCWLIGIIGALALFGLRPQPATAHPLGNFTINLYSRLSVGADQIAVTYIVDLAEIPTFQEFGGTTPDATAQATYLQQIVPKLRDDLLLVVDGQNLSLRAVDQQIGFPPGQGNLQTTRITIHFLAELTALAPDAQRSIEYEDRNYAERLGWHEIVVQPAAGARLLRSNAPTVDASNELRAYPQDMLASPLDMRSARLVVVRGSSASAAQSQQPVAANHAPDRFAALIAADELSPLVLLAALVSALGLGAVHALSPGHGKTIVAAYLIGARGTARHALFLGITVTATHTIGVFALGLITLYASRYILPEQLYPWLGMLSGGLVVALGLTLLRQRIGALRGGRMSAHTHDHPDHDHHHHNHDHYDHDHHHDHGLTHSHGGSTHTHAIPSADGSAVSWRSLLALGVSGGLIPCPSALVVMLSAISLGRVGLGLLLIVMFSVGLAGVLTGIGLLFVHGKRWIDRLSRSRLQRVSLGLRALPIASAVIMTTAGLMITAQAIVQAGVLR